MHDHRQGKWDVSSVTNMDLLFYNKASFNGELSNWDVSSVTDMTYIFQQTTAFNRDISKWDVSHVKNIFGMFV